MKSSVLSFTIVSFLLGVNCRTVPQNVKDFYDSVKSGNCEGKDKLKGGFYDVEDGPAGTIPC